MDDLYEASSDFFRPWSDRHMTLSSGMWQDGDGPDEAQQRKFSYLGELAGIGPGHRVLDLGCGFGGMLAHAVTVLGASEALGITTSASQVAHIGSLDLPGVAALREDICELDLKPGSFDAAVSIEGLEYAVDFDPATGECDTARLSGLFRRLHRWTVPKAGFGLEMCVAGPRVTAAPDGPAALQGVEDVPSARRPIPLPDLLRAAEPWWEPVSVTTDRDDALRTFEKGAANLAAHEEQARAFADGRWYELARDMLGFQADLLRAGVVTVARIGWRRNDSAA